MKNSGMGGDETIVETYTLPKTFTVSVTVQAYDAKDALNRALPLIEKGYSGAYSDSCIQVRLA